MLITTLAELLKARFPHSAIRDGDETLKVGSFPEWDSLANFDFLMSVEERFNVRFSVDEMAELKSLVDVARALKGHGVKD